MRCRTADTIFLCFEATLRDEWTPAGIASAGEGPLGYWGAENCSAMPHYNTWEAEVSTSYGLDGGLDYQTRPTLQDRFVGGVYQPPLLDLDFVVISTLTPLALLD